MQPPELNIFRGAQGRNTAERTVKNKNKLVNIQHFGEGHIVLDTPDPVRSKETFDCGSSWIQFVTVVLAR